MENKLISIIIATKNEEENIANCLESIIRQTYDKYEIIIVDNYSSDNTTKIAFKYTDKVFMKGNERSSQRNFGANKSSGKYLLFLDADMKLGRNVLKQCIDTVNDNNDICAIVIPEKSFGTGFWAECKKLEKSFYINQKNIEAARFFDKHIFKKVGGYNIRLISGEDWNISNRIKKYGRFSRINDFIYHNEGKLKLIDTLKKKFYYAQNYHLFEQNDFSHMSKFRIVLERYFIFLSQPGKLFKNPKVGAGLLLMKFLELSFGGFAYLSEITKKGRYKVM